MKRHRLEATFSKITRAAVLTFANPHRPRRKAAVGSRQLDALNDNETDEVDCGVERLRRLRALVEIDVVSSDSFGTARDELAMIPLEPTLSKPANTIKRNVSMSARASRNGSRLLETGETTH